MWSTYDVSYDVSGGRGSACGSDVWYAERQAGRDLEDFAYLTERALTYASSFEKVPARFRAEG